MAYISLDGTRRDGHIRNSGRLAPFRHRPLPRRPSDLAVVVNAAVPISETGIVQVLTLGLHRAPNNLAINQARRQAFKPRSLGEP
ncbi:hypothetical protein [Paraburkholderia fynbosensis]|uniref:Uncharacterized protein n=1 Tax=Paraburkholderia fynbosensis TaxID=1200993 RepID=A0A6J5FW54_9BURK|nr:hypothetical protein [Paraburkholderia fynbosensis]CAB3788570.1 hypothetical protein LMG27177_02441 [Paraburkholderia fynbosensis]